MSDEYNPYETTLAKGPKRAATATRFSGSTDWSTPLSIIGATILAAAVAIAHHLVDTHLDRRPVAGAGVLSQTWSSRIEIGLATVFQFAFTVSAGLSASQTCWYYVRRKAFTVKQLDVLLAAPELTAIWNVPRHGLGVAVPAVAALWIILLAAPLITILAPSLATQRSPTSFQRLAVPTLNTSTDAVLDDIYVTAFGAYGSVSDRWNTTALEALLSTESLGWPIPPGCAPECTYNFTYVAPAVRCADIPPEAIDDGVNAMYRHVPRNFTDPPAAYLLAYDALSVGAGYRSSPLNFTISNQPTLNGDFAYTWTLAWLPFRPENNEDSANGSGGVLINATGSQCTMLNATYAATARYSNGTQTTTVEVLEYHQPLNTSYKQSFSAFNVYPSEADVGVRFKSGFGAHLHLLAIADAISQHLAGELVVDAHTNVLTSTTFIAETGVFEPYDVVSLNGVSSVNPGMNTSAGITNVSRALEQLVANVTLGFVGLGAGTMEVDALVSSSALLYAYRRTSLIATYTVAFVLLLIVNALGLAAIKANGETSSSTFSRLLLVSRNPALDEVAKAVAGRAEGDVKDVRLRFVMDEEGRHPVADSWVFAVEGEREERAMLRGGWQMNVVFLAGRWLDGIDGIGYFIPEGHGILYLAQQALCNYGGADTGSVT
ncbi:hypothetical protein MKEN_01318300 [Mycena kentingensis (nom. inval.)]|nr:hypothetical protein MKEN_01318300 [Mycena kentingensis (nom. inval.)]